MNDTPSKTTHMLTEKVKLLQKAALFFGGKVLLLKRAATAQSRPGAWDLPGGNSEWPADGAPSHFGLHRDDLAREVREETGIQLPLSQLNFAAQKYCETFFDAERQTFSVIFGWHLQLPVEFDPQSVVVSDEHSEYAWVNPADLGSYDFAGERGQFAKDIILGKGQTSDSTRL